MNKTIKKIWHFIWEENSPLSWAVNVVLAFLIIKFLVYPGLGLVLETSNPVVAVVSGSMEHNTNLEEWWNDNGEYYERLNITENEFSMFMLHNGFNVGDLIILKGGPPSELNLGDIIVFGSNGKEPVIHRIISTTEVDGTYIFSTKGDNNNKQIDTEIEIHQDRIIGKAAVRVPLLGYVKILFENVIASLRR